MDPDIDSYDPDTNSYDIWLAELPAVVAHRFGPISMGLRMALCRAYSAPYDKLRVQAFGPHCPECAKIPDRESPQTLEKSLKSLDPGPPLLYAIEHAVDFRRVLERLREDLKLGPQRSKWIRMFERRAQAWTQ